MKLARVLFQLGEINEAYMQINQALPKMQTVYGKGNQTQLGKANFLKGDYHFGYIYNL